MSPRSTITAQAKKKFVVVPLKSIDKRGGALISVITLGEKVKIEIKTLPKPGWAEPQRGAGGA